MHYKVSFTSLIYSQQKNTVYDQKINGCGLLVLFWHWFMELAKVGCLLGRIHTLGTDAIECISILHTEWTDCPTV